MTNPALDPSSRRPRVPLARPLAVLLAALLLAVTPAAAVAQSLMQEPETKEQAKQAEEAQSTTPSSASDDSGNSGLIGLVVVGGLLIGGAAYWILRDSGDAVRERERPGPKRPVDSGAVGRGAPKAMFTGEGEAGGKTGKRKKREQGRRQRQARKANRPR